MEVVYTCPLGSECEVVKEGKLHRCRWFVKLQGSHPQTGAALEEYRCTEEWSVIMQVENTKVTHEVGAAVESFRNEMTRQNAKLIGQINGNANRIKHDTE